MEICSREVVRNRTNSHSLLIAAVLIGSISSLWANPVVHGDPSKYVLAYSTGILLAFCIAVETNILRIICRSFHRVDCDPMMTLAIVVLNIATFFGVLLPALHLSGSVILAELVVILVEGLMIRKIFKNGGAFMTMPRAMSYALFVNCVSYLIGLFTQ